MGYVAHNPHGAGHAGASPEFSRQGVKLLLELFRYIVVANGP
jgi:hypothetical protein